MKTTGKKLLVDEGFERYLNLNFKMLWLMGIVINLNDKAAVSKYWERLPTFTTNFLGITDGFFQVLWIIDVWSYDKHLVTKISSNFFSNITAICKGYRMATNAHDLQSILTEMSIMWKTNRPIDACRQQILLGAQKTVFFCKCYAGIGIGVVVTWGIPPVQNIVFQYLRREATNHTYDFSERIFMVRYPFPINTVAAYLSVLFEEQWVLFGSALGWICCDALFAQLTSHVCLQLQDSKLEFKLKYHEFWSLGANWSTTTRHSDYSAPYPLVNYTTYASSIEEFIEKYPTVTIETYGEANSPETFGDRGTGHFGSLQFETVNFNNQEFRRKHMVLTHESAFWWDTGAEIGVGFKTNDKKLYLQCFINGWIYSGGAVWRRLSFGLGVTKITFNPKTSSKNIIKNNSIN